MKILVSELFEKQLKDILAILAKQDYKATNNFKIYLDTIIINIPTKVNKYKKSIYFNDENIKDIEYNGCVIPFFIDERTNSYIVLGITTKS